MGLNITRICSNKEYLHSSNALHRVRYLACKVEGFKGSFSDYSHVDNPWEKFPRFRQLLHFSDNGGVLIPECYLENVDYENSFKLGNSNQLLRELRIIRDCIVKYGDINDKERASFSELYEIVEDEVENGIGILVFS